MRADGHREASEGGAPKLLGEDDRAEGGVLRQALREPEIPREVRQLPLGMWLEQCVVKEPSLRHRDAQAALDALNHAADTVGGMGRLAAVESVERDTVQVVLTAADRAALMRSIHHNQVTPADKQAFAAAWSAASAS